MAYKKGGLKFCEVVPRRARDGSFTVNQLKLLLLAYNSIDNSEPVAFDCGFGQGFASKLCIEIVQNNVSVYVPTSTVINVFQTKPFINSAEIDPVLKSFMITNGNRFCNLDSYYYKSNELFANSQVEVCLTEVLLFDPATRVLRRQKVFAFTKGSNNYAIEINQPSDESSSVRCVGNMCLDVDTLTVESNNLYRIDESKDKFDFLIVDIANDKSKDEVSNNIHDDKERLLVKLFPDDKESIRDLLDTSIQYYDLASSHESSWGGRQVFRIP